MLSAGLGLKPQHFEVAHACTAPGLWFEVHAENYMVDGGPRLAWLERIRASRPVSLHGVALSLAADAAPDDEHLKRLAALVERIEPALVSEHLAWSTWQGAYRPDLLPVRTARRCGGRRQHTRGRSGSGGRLLENPSHYLQDTHEAR
jgi:uncharacterized protein (UPF0276 family)